VLAACSLSDADHAYNDVSPRPRSVELDREEGLPLAEEESTAGDWYRFARAQEQLQAVALAVRAFVVVDVDGAHTKVVVAVVSSTRRGLLQVAPHVV
jgi:hypothetical protein